MIDRDAWADDYAYRWKWFYALLSYVAFLIFIFMVLSMTIQDWFERIWSRK